jgi:hypothetical protein
MELCAQADRDAKRAAQKHTCGLFVTTGKKEKASQPRKGLASPSAQTSFPAPSSTCILGWKSVLCITVLSVRSLAHGKRIAIKI